MNTNLNYYKKEIENLKEVNSLEELESQLHEIGLISWAESTQERGCEESTTWIRKYNKKEKEWTTYEICISERYGEDSADTDYYEYIYNIKITECTASDDNVEYFKLDKDDSIEVEGHTLYRVIYTDGDTRQGGYIENEDNLWGGAKVYNNACVFDEAEVKDNVIISGNARVCDGAHVCGNARVCGDAIVEDCARVVANAIVADNARVCGNAYISGFAEIRENAIVSDNASVGRENEQFSTIFGLGNTPIVVGGNARVRDCASICKGARVGGNAVVEDNAKVTDIAVVCGDAIVAGYARVSCMDIISEGKKEDDLHSDYLGFSCIDIKC